jgi:hypothetical protein
VQFDLSFSRGDRITITKAEDVSGWWSGQVCARTCVSSVWGLVSDGAWPAIAWCSTGSLSEVRGR